MHEKKERRPYEVKGGMHREPLRWGRGFKRENWSETLRLVQLMTQTGGKKRGRRRAVGSQGGRQSGERRCKQPQISSQGRSRGRGGVAVRNGHTMASQQKP
eukprot:3343958-Pleurochrysis_carterae.AAC.1